MLTFYATLGLLHRRRQNTRSRVEAARLQYLTIIEGPNRPLRETNLELEPLGRLPHPYGPQYFRGNRFGIQRG